MTRPVLTRNQIKQYNKNGVLVLRDIFKPWIKSLRVGFNKALDKPSINSRENISLKDQGRFFEDYCNWKRIKEFKNCIKYSPAAQILAEATGSKFIQIFHEHIFMKDPSTTMSTPWHQDMPYYCLKGNITGSYWIPLDKIDKKNSLKLILGSHKWKKLLKPTKWSNNKSWYKRDGGFMNLPSIDKIKKKIFVPRLKLGDAILFNFKIVHSSPGNTLAKSRRAFSMRFIGDDVRFYKRSGETSPPFKNIKLKNGDMMRKDWFPIIWKN
tara:strand:+ start:410 stop:1210 length:801 start_codon:yes stop_codon:yes gene_type:complete